MNEVQPLTTPEWLELSGIGYNLLLQNVDKFGNFKVDLEIVDSKELERLKDFVNKYGLKTKDRINYMENGQPVSKTGTFIAFRAEKSGPTDKFTRMCVPTLSAKTNEVITDLISNGAAITVRFKVYGYKGGVNAQGYKWKGGNATQLETVEVHGYE